MVKRALGIKSVKAARRREQAAAPAVKAPEAGTDTEPAPAPPEPAKEKVAKKAKKRGLLRKKRAD